MNKSFTIWILGALVLAIGFGLMIYFSSGSASQTEQNSEISLNDFEWAKGNLFSTVVLLEYSDFQCPSCAYYYPVIKQIEKDYGSKIKIVYRHFPIFQKHKNAILAASAAEAAGMQSNFWGMHDLLFESQNVWAESDKAEELFVAHAETLSLNIEKFKSDMLSEAVKDEVMKDYQSGVDAGVAGTPSFFVNGKFISNPNSYEELAKILDSYITK